jgi:hypothetical protein
MDYLSKVRQIKEDHDGNELNDLLDVFYDIKGLFGSEEILNMLIKKFSIEDLEFYLEELIKDLDI